jgi:AcrR family transcriptional regulator
MTRRAEQVDDTRQRIIAATVDLHGSVGPADTSVAAIAAAAGVTRATVYRHFPDETALFSACSAHWQAGQQLPDPSAWGAIADPKRRLRAGLADVYRFYRDGAPMLFRVYRDIAAMPEAIRASLHERDRRLRELFAAAFPLPQRSPALLAALGHAVSFWTWHSLCVEQALDNAAAVELMCELAGSAARLTVRGGSGQGARQGRR